MTNALVATAVDPDVSAALQIYERIKPLKDALGVDKLTDGELQVFAYVARFTGLDPFTKQIYAIKRGGRVTHQTGIDGYRSVAERTKQYAGSDEPEYEACNCGQDDSPKDHPKVARVVIHRVREDGIVVDQIGVARWHELKPAHTKFPNANDFQDAMWWKQPYGQLSKCAEANGLRKAFPRVLGGVYIAEEMQGADIVEGESRDVTNKAAERPTASDRIAARRAEREAQKPAADEPTTEPAAAAEQPDTQEVEGDAAWLADGADDAQPAAEPEESGLTFLELLRAAADSLELDGPATDEQRDALLKALQGLPSATVLAGVKAVWPESVVEGKAKLTASQAAAVIMTAGTTHPDEFKAAWQDLAA